jgi:hypothetical protein
MECVKLMREEGAHDAVYRRNLDLLMVGPFEMDFRDSKFCITENVLRKGELVVFSSKDENEACEKLIELVRQRVCSLHVVNC